MSTTTTPKIDLDSQTDPFWFDDACDDLTEWLDQLNPDSNEYRSRGQDVGWQNTSGTTTVTLTDGKDLIQKLTPNGSWELTATLYDDRIELQLSHHDSPTGELHVLYPATEAA